MARFSRGQSGNPKGRPPGIPNKATAEVKAIAGQHTAAAIAELVRILTSSHSDQARVAAARELLDRAHGKPAQAITGGGGGPIETIFRWLSEPAKS